MKKVLLTAASLGAALLAVVLIAGLGSTSAGAVTPASNPSLLTATTSPSASPTASPTGSPTASPTPTPTPTPTHTPPKPLRVLSVAPKRGARLVSPASTITVTFSAPLASDTPRPHLSPAVPGHWLVRGAELVFKPTGHLPIYSAVHLHIYAGSAGAHARDGGRMKTAFTSGFTVKGPTSRLRLQQLLAELGYLPLRLRIKDAKPASALAHEPGTSDLVSVQPVHAAFSWRFAHIPATLSALWHPGTSSVLVKGAIMTFELRHGLSADGIAGPKVWTALLKAAAAHQAFKGGYNYIEVSKAQPETLRVWRSGRIIYRSLANTGIASRPTANGTFAVYAHLVSTTMSGTNPDGSHYNDTGIPHVAYFNGGDAVHGFIRASYGFPQSLGCVELPFSAAALVFKYDNIGTLVTVR
jgi:peptidoglycan hydrolase-like protein with peptidoglycan-binding domain